MATARKKNSKNRSPQNGTKRGVTAGRPTKLTLRAYRVGFGDCFLLTFHYKRGSERHILIDFGSTGLPKGVGSGQMMSIARDIEAECGGKLHAVVATHRHKDHISGFATNAAGTATGNIIASLNPDVVIQPWTEHADLAPTATAPTGTALRSSASAGGNSASALNRAFVGTLMNMHAVAAAAVSEARRLTRLNEEAAAAQRAGASTPVRRAAPVALVRQLAFLGENNLQNLSAIRNLMSMGKRRVYVHYGTASGLERVLPGVRIHVLGPPTVKQSDKVLKQRSRDEEQFWHLQAAAEGTNSGGRRRMGGPFEGTPALAGTPPYARWFVPRMRNLRGDQLLQIVRTVDKALNNTSVILLFEIGRRAFLFPGDAQIENWSYTLSKSADRERLSRVTLYKVGHHGSLNATPKSLWKLFESHRGPEGTPGRLTSVVSTMKGKHGDPDSGTEVPRRKLVAALSSESDFHTTENLRSPDLKDVIEVDL
jgi:hypothetical protein